jgi:hypothetical protein
VRRSARRENFPEEDCWGEPEESAVIREKSFTNAPQENDNTFTLSERGIVDGVSSWQLPFPSDRDLVTGRGPQSFRQRGPGFMRIRLVSERGPKLARGLFRMTLFEQEFSQDKMSRDVLWGKQE